MYLGDSQISVSLPLHPTGKGIRRNPMAQPFLLKFCSVQLSSLKRREELCKAHVRVAAYPERLKGIDLHVLLIPEAGSDSGVPHICTGFA